MNDFQIIGIRPLEGCDEKYRKNLKTDKLLCFNDKFKIQYGAKNQIVSISINEAVNNVPDDFYSLNPRITISALVGQNGSGKSAIAELFLYVLFSYGRSKNILKPWSISKDHDSSDSLSHFSDFAQYEDETKKIDKFLNVELLFLEGEEFYRILLVKSKFRVFTARPSIDIDRFTFKEIDFADFNISFYSMYFNYSIHGLNTYDMGIWLKTLFHKNDGYQLPIVVNPFREKGKIDINNENYLARNRLFTNVLEINKEDVVLPNNQIEFIEVAFAYKKDLEIPKRHDNYNSINEYLIRPLFMAFFKGLRYPKVLNSDQEFVEAYIQRKIKTICERYQAFKKYESSIRRLYDENIVEDKNINYLIEDLCSDRSHVTLKLRQSLNFINKDIYKLPKNENKKNYELNDLRKSINGYLLELDNKANEIIDFLPPPIYITRFYFREKSHFDLLSSGEKQQIYSLHSILYHLRNLDSVYNGLGQNLRYQNVNLILDEIELYYHPDFQKHTIERLIGLLSKANFNNLRSINILFLTHSPFILSDIPSQLVTRLKDGQVLSDIKKESTFAANITDLLTDSFFLQDGLIGEFARKKIDKVIGFLNFKMLENEVRKLEDKLDSDRSARENRTTKLELEYKKSLLSDLQDFRNEQFNKSYIKKFIELVDEPLLKDGIKQLFEKTSNLIG
ncbi:MAG: hypothetical protein WBG46_06330 [Nonlabens sp.]